MHDDDGYFDERVAARYDQSAAEMFDPAVVDPVIDLLADLPSTHGATRSVPMWPPTVG